MLTGYILYFIFWICVCGRLIRKTALKEGSNFSITLSMISSRIYALLYSIFADDTSLYIVVDNPDAVPELLNIDYKKISDWANSWHSADYTSRKQTYIILTPWNPTFKLGFTGVYIIFSYFCSKHRLWVFFRTASSKYEKYKNFHFLVANFSIYLNRRVLVMDFHFLLDHLAYCCIFEEAQ